MQLITLNHQIITQTPYKVLLEVPLYELFNEPFKTAPFMQVILKKHDLTNCLFYVANKVYYALHKFKPAKTFDETVFSKNDILMLRLTTLPPPQKLTINDLPKQANYIF